jgi:hypothetical protein
LTGSMGINRFIFIKLPYPTPECSSTPRPGAG